MKFVRCKITHSLSVSDEHWCDYFMFMFTGCFKKSNLPKTFWNIFTSVKSFCVKFWKFVGNSYPHIFTNFCRFILVFHWMALIFPRVLIVFTLSSFEYSPIKWKCSVPASEMMSFFRYRMSGNCKQCLIFYYQRFTDIILMLGSTYQRENCLTMTNYW